jgi:hypothetical protein
MNDTIDISIGDTGVQPKPWWKRNSALIAGGATVLAATGLALGLGLGLSNGSSGAAGIVRGDGYTITQILSASEIHDKLANDKTPEDQVMKTMIDGDAAVGVKGDTEEAAVKLTATGKQFFGTLMPIIEAANSENAFKMVGDYIVISGSKASFDSNGGAFGLGS